MECHIEVGNSTPSGNKKSIDAIKNFGIMSLILMAKKLSHLSAAPTSFRIRLKFISISIR